jgi:hypothetical protein
METAGPTPWREGVPRDPVAARCPSCGVGDLVLTRVARRDGEAGRAAYCAGAYDGRRRRIVRRSCGWAGAAPGPGPGPQ